MMLASSRGAKPPIARRQAGGIDVTEERPESHLLAERREKLKRLREAGIEPFPHAFEGRTEIAEIRAAHEGLAAGDDTDDRRRVAGRIAARRGHGKAAFIDLVDRSGQDPAPRPGGPARRRVVRAPGRARPRRHHRRRGHRLRHQARRALASAGRLDAARQEPAPAAGQVPRARGRGAPLPTPRARPDRQPGSPGAVREASASGRRDPRVARRARLPRGRDPGPAAALRRRAGAPVHHPPQRARPRPLPADRHRALPEALRRSGASSGSTSSARTFATRASRRSTTPSSRCSSGTRPTPTTPTPPSGSSSWSLTPPSGSWARPGSSATGRRSTWRRPGAG